MAALGLKTCLCITCALGLVGYQAVADSPGPIRRIRATGTIQALRVSNVQVPQLRGPGGRLTLIRLIPNGARVKPGDVVAEFDRIQQLEDGREARAKVEDLKPGQIVLAIGRPGSLKATFGTISAVSSSWRGWRGSEIEHLIQTNAPLYPGFSGGPLVDVDGRVVGMNSWVFGRGDGRAIAMDVAERVVASLRTEGRIKRPYLGIGTQEVPLPDAVKGRVNQESGLLIVAVEPQSPADKAGLMQGDTLVALDGSATKSLEDLYSGLRKIKVGSTQTVKVVRAGEVKEIPVTVGEAGR